MMESGRWGRCSYFLTKLGDKNVTVWLTPTYNQNVAKLVDTKGEKQFSLSPLDALVHVAGFATAAYQAER